MANIEVDVKSDEVNAAGVYALLQGTVGIRRSCESPRNHLRRQERRIMRGSSECTWMRANVTHTRHINRHAHTVIQAHACIHNYTHTRPCTHILSHLQDMFHENTSTLTCSVNKPTNKQTNKHNMSH